MTVFNSVIFARRLDAVDHHFEFADDKHISVNPQEILCGKVFLFFLDRFLILVHSCLLYTSPLYRSEGKEILEIGIGCTGGKHRSVAITNALASAVQTLGYSVFTEHRDILK